jgi:hypothetical protein
MERVCETFADGPLSPWRTHLVGAGQLEATGTSWRFSTEDAASRTYSNSQIDDYQGLPRSRFAWHPPLRLTVRARFSHRAEQLRGTAGFGFWNDPLLMTEKRLPALPGAVWFFYASSPSNMKLDVSAPGYGWKAASIDARRSAALFWASLAPLLVPLMNHGRAYRICWPPIQRALRIREAVIPVDMTQWHTYCLDWGKEYARFRLVGERADSSRVMLAAPSPRGPLGFVMWLDNQFLVLTPWGRIRWGLLDVPGRQWMEVDYLEISPLGE